MLKDYLSRTRANFQGHNQWRIYLQIFCATFCQACRSKWTFSSFCSVSKFFNLYRMWTRSYRLKNYLVKSVAFLSMNKSVWKIEKNNWHRSSIICTYYPTTYIGKPNCKTWSGVLLTKITSRNCKSNVIKYYMRTWWSNCVIIKRINYLQILLVVQLHKG